VIVKRQSRAQHCILHEEKIFVLNDHCEDLLTEVEQGCNHQLGWAVSTRPFFEATSIFLLIFLNSVSCTAD